MTDDMKALRDIASRLMAEPKGLLAADESTKSATKRFEALKISSTPENRRAYRQMLFTTPNFAQYISGVILYDETIRQNDDTNQSFARLLTKDGVLPGIKVDKGLVELTNFPGETITEGLDGLADRLVEYYKMGARFTKWRAAFAIDERKNLPTSAAIHANLSQMSRYAALAQAAGMVPIVEPEVLYDGAHSIEAAAEVTSQVLRVLFDILIPYRVDLAGVILKTSMVLAGKGNPTQSFPAEVAEATLKVLKDRVPPDIAGIVFLSGGQTPDQATANLNAIGQESKQSWPITFSYSRAVQDPAMKAWAGKKANVKKAQAIFAELLSANSAARMGQFSTSKKLQNVAKKSKKVVDTPPA